MPLNLALLATAHPDDVLKTIEVVAKRDKRDYSKAVLSTEGVKPKSRTLTPEDYKGNKFAKRIVRFFSVLKPTKAETLEAYMNAELSRYKDTHSVAHIKHYLYYRNKLIRLHNKEAKARKRDLALPKRDWKHADPNNLPKIYFEDYRPTKEDDYPMYQLSHLKDPVRKLLSKYASFRTFTPRVQEEMVYLLSHAIVSGKKAPIPQNFLIHRTPTLIRQQVDKTTGEVHTGYAWLQEYNLLRTTDYTMGYMTAHGKYHTGICRRWTVNPKLYTIDLQSQEEMLESMSHTKQNFKNATFYFSKDGSRHRITPQCKQAMECDPIVLNITAAKKRLAELKADKATQGKYLNDLRCLNLILSQATTFKHDNTLFATYTPKYRVVSTGRIQEFGGGLQTISRLSKQALLHKTGIRNVDIKGSQVMILEQTLRNHGFTESADRIKAYCNTNRAKLAAKCTLPESVFKRVVLSTIFGATMSLKNGRTFQDLVASVHPTPEARERCLRLCKRHLSFLTQAIEDYDSIFAHKTTHVNAMGTIYKGNYSSKVRAHYLQGQEADLVRRQTKCANEHDGYMTHTKESLELLQACHKQISSVTNLSVSKEWSKSTMEQAKNSKLAIWLRTLRNTKLEQCNLSKKLQGAMRKARITITYALIYTSDIYTRQGSVCSTYTQPLDA